MRNWRVLQERTSYSEMLSWGNLGRVLMRQWLGEFQGEHHEMREQAGAVVFHAGPCRPC